MHSEGMSWASLKIIFFYEPASFSFLEDMHFFLKLSRITVLEGKVVFGQEGWDCWSAKWIATERGGIKE